MNFVKIVKSSVVYGVYNSKEATNMGMEILGMFLTEDNHCSKSSWQKWALESQNLSDDYDYPYGTGGNITLLAIDKYGFLRIYSDLDDELYPDDSPYYNENAAHAKVCKTNPQEVLLKHVNNQYIIEIIKE